MEDINIISFEVNNMRFFNIINTLKEQYNTDSVVRENGTLLLGISEIPSSRYMLFKPLKEEYIQDYLVSEYKNKFPQDYIDFLKFCNGANLCKVKLNTQHHAKKIQFCHFMFVIFGLPLTPPLSRPLDKEEPYDIRIEDLARHDSIPKTWLKCGTYTRNCNFNVTNDIFIDTENNRIYACEKNCREIVDSWSTLDECFCDIYNSLADIKLEYDFYPKK